MAFIVINKQNIVKKIFIIDIICYICISMLRSPQMFVGDNLPNANVDNYSTIANHVAHYPGSSPHWDTPHWEEFVLDPPVCGQNFVLQQITEIENERKLQITELEVITLRCQASNCP